MQLYSSRPQLVGTKLLCLKWPDFCALCSANLAQLTLGLCASQNCWLQNDAILSQPAARCNADHETKPLQLRETYLFLDINGIIKYIQETRICITFQTFDLRSSDCCNFGPIVERHLFVQPRCSPIFMCLTQ